MLGAVRSHRRRNARGVRPLDVTAVVRTELDRLRGQSFATTSFTEGWRSALDAVDGKLKNIERSEEHCNECCVNPACPKCWPQ